MDDREELLAALKTHDMTEVIHATRALLGRRGAGAPLDGVVSALVDVLASSPAEEASLAAFALALLSRAQPIDRAVGAMVQACGHADADVRVNAWQALTAMVANMHVDRYAEHVLPLLATAEPEEAMRTVQAAGKRGFDIRPALPGVLELLKRDGDFAQAANILPAAGRAGCDLHPALAGLKALVGRRERVGDEVAEGLAWAALSPARWESLDELLEHPSATVQKAARETAGLLLERRKDAARARGDKQILKEALEVRRRLNR